MRCINRDTPIFFDFPHRSVKGVCFFTNGVLGVNKNFKRTTTFILDSLIQFIRIYYSFCGIRNHIHFVVISVVDRREITGLKAATNRHAMNVMRTFLFAMKFIISSFE